MLKERENFERVLCSKYNADGDYDFAQSIWQNERLYHSEFMCLETRCSAINGGKGIYEIPQPLLSLDNLDNSTIQYFTTHIELRSFSRQSNKHAVTRIRTWVIAATTQCTNHYTITAMHKSVDFIGVYTRNV